MANFVYVHNVEGSGSEISRGVPYLQNPDQVISILPYAGHWEHVTLHTTGGVFHIWESLPEYLSLKPYDEVLTLPDPEP